MSSDFAATSHNARRRKPHADLQVSVARRPFARALQDLWQGLLAYRVWGVLGWTDVRRRYRRSLLGPLWITLSLAVFVGALGFLYAELFDRALPVYLPHLTAGYICWLLIGQLIDSGARCFVNGEGILKQLSVPVSVHAYRAVWAALLTSAHHVIIFVLVAAIFAVTPTLYSLLAIAGLLLIVLTAIPLALLIGTIAARFRDVPIMIQSVMRIMLFLTPVIWMADLVPRRAIFLTWNPFYHFIEVVRAPLLGTPFDPLHWQFTAACAALAWVAALVVFSRFRARIAYWL